MESVGFVEKLKSQLVAYPDTSHGGLQIEVLETIALNDIDNVREVIEQCRKIGVGFALDDFGSGFSTQARLDCLECDEIKIDKGLVLGIEHVDEQRRIVEHMVELAHARGMSVCAEGVETQAALDILGSLRVDRAQGFLIGRPQFESTLAQALRRWGTGRDLDATGDHPQLVLPGFHDTGAGSMLAAAM